MWFIVLVLHAFRCAVISSSFQFAQFGMVMTLIKRCRLRKIRWLRCFDMVVERAWSCPLQDWFQTITTSEIAQLGRVTETRHIESAICAVQAFRWRGWQLCRCGQEGHIGTVLRKVMGYGSFGRFVTVFHCRGGQGKSRELRSLQKHAQTSCVVHFLSTALKSFSREVRVCKIRMAPLQNLV